MRSNVGVQLLLSLSLGVSLGCPAESGEVGALLAGSSSSGAASSSGETPGSESSDGETEASSGAVEDEPCFGGELACCLDADGDGVADEEDNAPQTYNPGQRDSDADGVGDRIDTCVLIATEPGEQTDSDGDGLGDACDLCAAPRSFYDEAGAAGGVPDYLRVRSIPGDGDLDRDGVGDACDNCPSVPNCLDFGPENPFVIGDVEGGGAPTVDFSSCQADADGDGIGDACDADAGAAEPAGFGDEQDFDGDGLANLFDACPRLPLAVADRVACTVETEAEDCGAGRSCAPSGFCNHTDTDGDGVGDLCDTCPGIGNPAQVAGEGGSVEDDPDDDFVGAACELSCADTADPRPLGHVPVSSLGACCVALLVADAESGDLFRARTCEPGGEVPESCDPLLAPDLTDPGSRVPLRLAAECSKDQASAGECRSLPAQVAATPGVLTLPIGCEDALSGASVSAMENLLADGSVDEACRMPQADDDFDGVAGSCDLCEHTFDPDNAAATLDGETVPDEGAACFGAASSCE